MNDIYVVKQYKNKKEINISVPGSKSITNRALMLAAISNGICVVNNILFSDDSRAFLDCLNSIGFELKIDEYKKTVTVYGQGGKIPCRNAEINVRSAGTAARFLTALLAFSGGNYVLNSSEQMKKRPIKPLLDVLKREGVHVKYLENEGFFPFEIKSSGIHGGSLEIDTGLSSQFASALMMSGAVCENGIEIKMSGKRIEGAYIKLTYNMMKHFNMDIEKNNSCFYVRKKQSCINEYNVEPDLSAACYFYAMAPLLNINVTVNGVYKNSIQGDLKFIYVLEKLGCKIDETEKGIKVYGVESYYGITVDMNDFSDQTMTLSAIAPFAKSPTTIKNIEHIRYQESDRISAIINELSKLGIICHELETKDGIIIYPGDINSGVVETYDDHRIAMSFSLIGLKTGGIKISNPMCCRKTFEGFFDLLDDITK